MCYSSFAVCVSVLNEQVLIGAEKCCTCVGFSYCNLFNIPYDPLFIWESEKCFYKKQFLRAGLHNTQVTFSQTFFKMYRQFNFKTYLFFFGRTCFWKINVIHEF